MPRAQQVAYCFSNQFELPVLFYVLTILAIMTQQGRLSCSSCWPGCSCSRGSRHAYMHTTSNRVLHRGAVYMVGALVLMAMWLIFIVRILLGLP